MEWLNSFLQNDFNSLKPKIIKFEPKSDQAFSSNNQFTG